MEESTIGVICRARPQLNETARKWSIENGRTILGPDGASISFKRVFDERASTYDILEEINPLIPKLADGYSLCVAAYGNTNSGKTYTMCGDETSDGLIVLTARSFIDFMKSQTKRACLMKLHVFEVYNEKVYDLLSDEMKEFKPREANGVLQLLNSESVTIFSVECVTDTLNLIMKRRAQGSTAQNDRSSRSHVVFHFSIESELCDGTDGCLSTLQLVDLAGSESAEVSSEVDRRLEGANINKSLVAFVKVIQQLNKKGHISYRDSKLTYLLKSSLSHAMLVLVCAVDLTMEKATRSTFSFAQSAQNVRLKFDRTKRTESGELDELRKKLKEKNKELEILKNTVDEDQRRKEELEKLHSMLLGGVQYERERKPARRASWGGYMTSSQVSIASFFDTTMKRPRPSTENLSSLAEVDELVCGGRLSNDSLQPFGQIEHFQTTPSNGCSTTIKIDVSVQAEDDSESLIQYLRQKIEDSKKTLESVREDVVNDIRSRVEEAWQRDRDTIQQLRFDCEKLQALYDTAMSDKENICVVSAPTEDFAALQENLASERSTVKSLQCQLAMQVKEVIKLQGELNSQVAMVKSLNSRLATATDSAQTQIIQMREQCAQFEEQLANVATSTAKKYETDIARGIKELERLRAQLESMKLEKTSQLKKINELQQLCDSLNVKLTEKNRQCETLQKTESCSVSLNDHNKLMESVVINAHTYDSVQQLKDRIIHLEEMRMFGVEKYNELKRKNAALASSLKQYAK